MFGYDPLTTVTALLALGALLVGLSLLAQRKLIELIGPVFVGAAAWTVGGLTVSSFVGVATAAVGALIALLTSVAAAAADGLGLNIPVVPIVLAVLALFLLSRSRGKSKK